ncbi:hypothetical protein B7463_g9754, partial [Scytalidium lignicola]
MTANPIVFITGANAGLGLETVKALFRSSKQYTILLGSRSIEKANAAAQEVKSEFPQSATVTALVQVDIEDDESIQRAFDFISNQYGRVDILINNAGAMFDSELASGKMTMREAWNKSWNVNTTGTNILTHTFVPLLLKSLDPRLIFIASGTSTLAGSEDLSLRFNQSPGKGWPKQIPGLFVPAYRSSKTGMNMVMREWTRILKEDGVKVWAVSPGFLATGLGGDQEKNKRMGALDPVIGADFVRDVVEGARDGDVGKRSTKADNGHHSTAEDRLTHLESLVKLLMQSQALIQPGNNSESSIKVKNSPEPPQVLKQSVGLTQDDRVDEARYVGSTHWSAVLDDIQELKVVLASQIDVQETDRATSLETTGLGNEVIFGSPKDYSIQQIISQYLPSKADLDRFVTTYFEGKNFTLPLMHTYHFQRQYQDFWEYPENVNPLWLSILFSISCMASLIRASIGCAYSPPQDVATKFSVFHAAAGQCLVIGKYHRPQQFVLEALTLYAHCKNLRSLEPSREAGTIFAMAVRMAYEMGYHRDPDSFGSFTVFEGEMRRRFWSVFKQIDVMTSFQLGLPSNICLENCDTRSPSNLLDSDFDVDTQILPPSRPENEPTKLLWFIVKDKQIVGFSKVCKDALSFNEKSEAEIFELDKEIRQMHTTIPDILRTRPLAESLIDMPFLVMTRLYVEFIYQKSLCVLHRKYMTRGNLFSTRSCIEAGKSLVSQFINMFKEFVPGGHLYKERWMLTNFTMNDFHLGIMVLCLAINIRRKRGSRYSAINSTVENEILPLLEQARVICIAKSASSIDARHVAHAISIILGGSHPSQMSPTLSSDLQSSHNSAQNVDLRALSLQPQSEWIEGNVETHGWLDSFNFMGDEFENMDWATFDPLVSGQDVSDMNINDFEGKL